MSAPCAAVSDMRSEGWLPYVTGGFAWGHSHVDVNDADGSVISSPGQTQFGWTAGAGVEFAVSGNWSAKLEYDYIDLSRRMIDLSAFGLPGVNVDPNIHLVKLGLNYRFGDTPPWVAPDSGKDRAAGIDRLERARANHLSALGLSLVPLALCRHRTACRAADRPAKPGPRRPSSGVRLWQGGEFYFNPELAQGFGLNGTLGLAGFPNGEAQKAGAPFPKFRPQRYYFKQTFGLGGEQEDVADAANQLPGKRDIDRVTLIVGTLCGRRFLRRQFLRQGSARRLHELGDVVVGRLRLPGRSAGLHPRRRGRAQSQGLGGARRRVRGADRAQQRRPHLQDRRHRRRIRGASRDLRSARQTAARRLRQQRQYRQLSRRRWRSKARTPRSTSTP